MMVKRKLDGAVDKSSADREICKLDATVRNCEKSGGLQLHPGLTAGRLVGCEIWARLEILKACYRSKYSIFHLV